MTTPSTDRPNCKVVEPAPAEVAEAGRVLRTGGLVAFPTETVYGLGADATNDLAVANIFKLKERPAFNPLIVHVRDVRQAAEFADFSNQANALAEAFWPGALTLVLKRKADAKLSRVVSAGLDTVAVRVPAHPVAQALLTQAGVPIAAPSANKSGYISPTQASHVWMQFKNDPGLSLIIDGGPCPVGVESTIVDVSGPVLTLLRPGGISEEDIEAVIGPLATRTSDVVIAPGQMKSHYAPQIPLRMNVAPNDRKNGESLLGFGPNMPLNTTLNLSPTGNLLEAAANLFTMMRTLDVPGVQGIAVTPIPHTGLGRAINDRLSRASTTKA